MQLKSHLNSIAHHVRTIETWSRSQLIHCKMGIDVMCCKYYKFYKLVIFFFWDLQIGKLSDVICVTFKRGKKKYNLVKFDMIKCDGV